MKLRRDDNVLIIKGRDRGKQGRIQQVLPKENKVLVEGMNIVLRHQKPTGTVTQAGIIQKELPMYAENVILICTHCSRPTRIKSKTLADGTRARLCNQCQEVIE